MDVAKEKRRLLENLGTRSRQKQISKKVFESIYFFSAKIKLYDAHSKSPQKVAKLFKMRLDLWVYIGICRHWLCW